VTRTRVNPRPQDFDTSGRIAHESAAAISSMYAPFGPMRHRGYHRHRGAIVLPACGHVEHAGGCCSDFRSELLNQITDVQGLVVRFDGKPNRDVA
jgi:hypothetical protein